MNKLVGQLRKSSAASLFDLCQVMGKSGDSGSLKYKDLFKLELCTRI